jgi:hypothetical protein
VIDIRFMLRRALAPLSRIFYPEYGTCHRCGLCWKFAQPHATAYAPGRSCFPLCEPCWRPLTVEERIPYYHQLHASWKSMDASLETQYRGHYPDVLVLEDAVRAEARPHYAVMQLGPLSRWYIVRVEDGLGWGWTAWSGSRWVPLGGDVQVCNFATKDEAAQYAAEHIM